MKTYDELKQLFLAANESFLRQDIELLNSEVSERALCGALMLHLNRLMMQDGTYDGYYTDVEYNRNRGNIRTHKKTIKGPFEQIIRITCDLIVHSRGKNKVQDNLIAVEMKKSAVSQVAKDKDKDRLSALTKSRSENIELHTKGVLPEQVCGYVIGIYYEIDYKKRNIYLEFYKCGNLFERGTIDF